jgi:hypothetical protein
MSERFSFYSRLSDVVFLKVIDPNVHKFSTIGYATVTYQVM